jgi:PAS domain S-box-containing protein
MRAIVMADAGGIIRMWSPGAEELFGYASADAVGQSLELIVPETYRERHWAGFHAAMQGDTSERASGVASVPVRRHDGSITRYAVRLMVLGDAWSKAVGAAAIFAPAEDAADGAPPLYEL